MKHKTIPLTLFKKVEKVLLSGGCQISDFPIELISLVVSKRSTNNVVVVVSADVFWNIYESTPFNNGRMYAIPPQKRISPADGFISLSDRLLLQIKSLLIH